MQIYKKCSVDASQSGHFFHTITHIEANEFLKYFVLLKRQNNHL